MIDVLPGVNAINFCSPCISPGISRAKKGIVKAQVEGTLGVFLNKEERMYRGFTIYLPARWSIACAFILNPFGDIYFNEIGYRDY